MLPVLPGVDEVPAGALTGVVLPAGTVVADAAPGSEALGLASLGMLAGLGTLVQIGFALGVGVLLDTFLVRPFLVPSLLLIVWRGEEAADRPAMARRRYPRPFREAG